MSIDYDHSKNLHTLDGPRAALPIIFGEMKPQSLLDVGCGAGTWLRAASDLGVSDIFGVDGVAIPSEQLRLPAKFFKHVDLTKALDLKRRFDCVLCLEVAEHLDASAAGVLTASLARHSDLVIFSAACPGQTGQHHVNCQWPDYWQQFFNVQGFVCSDDVRWLLWNQADIEPWYRQNIFLARRDLRAGTEPRLKAVVHPEIFRLATNAAGAPQFSAHVDQIERGGMPVEWYLRTPVRAMLAKIRRRGRTHC